MSARIGILLLWSLVAPVWGAGERLYYFLDDNGVPHYSNVPGDPRYQPLGPSGAPPGTPGSPVAPLPPPATVAPLAPAPVLPGAVPLPPDEGDEDER